MTNPQCDAAIALHPSSTAQSMQFPGKKLTTHMAPTIVALFTRRPGPPPGRLPRWKSQFPVTNDHDRLNRIQHLTSEAVLRVLHDEPDAVIVCWPFWSAYVAADRRVAIASSFPKESQGGSTRTQLNGAVQQFLHDPSHQSQSALKVASEIRAEHTG